MGYPPTDAQTHCEAGKSLQHGRDRDSGRHWTQ